MTQPAPVLYSTIANLRQAMNSTDTGTGTGAALTDAQLTLALQAASARVSVFAGNIFDGSSAQAVPPAIFEPLTLDLAAFWAYKMYLKHKVMDPQHPVLLAYTDAMKILTDVRDGKLRLDVVTVGGIGEEIGVVINRIPPVFNSDDSNTRIDPTTGFLQSDTPFSEWTPHSDDPWAFGPVYQG